MNEEQKEYIEDKLCEWFDSHQPWDWEENISSLIAETNVGFPYADMTGLSIQEINNHSYFFVILFHMQGEEVKEDRMRWNDRISGEIRGVIVKTQESGEWEVKEPYSILSKLEDDFKIGWEEYEADPETQKEKNRELILEAMDKILPTIVELEKIANSYKDNPFLIPNMLDLHGEDFLDDEDCSVSYHTKFLQRAQSIYKSKALIEQLKKDFQEDIENEEKNKITLRFYIFSRSRFDQIAQNFENIKNHLDKLNEIEKPMPDVLCFLDLLARELQLVEISISKAIKEIKVFHYLSRSNSGLVMIGLNGSGKTSFAKQITKTILGSDNVVVIPSEKSFSYQKRERLAVNLNKEVILDKEDISISRSILGMDEDDQTSEKTETQYLSKFDAIIDCLIGTHLGYLDQKDSGENADDMAENSYLENVIDIWNKLIHKLEIAYTVSGGFKVSNNNDAAHDYEIDNLSDGEKAALYYVACVLLAGRNSYIIVDEPENHINLALVNNLWDELEGVRPDCQFIYLTHNHDFAISRGPHTKFLWIEDINPKSPEWKYKEVPDIEGISKRLLIELVGNTKPILFCEGEDKGSLDYRMYSILFSNFRVTPAGGCENVIKYTKALNQRNILLERRAFGIIDGDFRTKKQIQSLKAKNVFCISLPEVENLFCDESLLEEVAANLPETSEKGKEELLRLLKIGKEAQASHRTQHSINRKIQESLPPKKAALKSLIRKYGDIQIPSGSNIKKIHDEHLSAIEKLIDKGEYQERLEAYNSKAVLDVGRVLAQDYEMQVLSILKNNEELRQELKSKYFPELVQEENPQ